MTSIFRFRFGLILLLLTALSSRADEPSPRWWKGNLHTHSLWSDGDDFPEMITGWYKAHGYDFLGISDHNVLQQPERWTKIGTNKVRQVALDKYLARYGTNWVQIRGDAGALEVRLKPLLEYAPLFQEAGKFLLIQSEEITDKFKSLPIHMNASNIREFIPPQGGDSVREVMQNNVNAVLDQSQKTGQPILPHLNHPNFGWGVTAEDLAAVHGERFFEVYNGHPLVHNEGDETHVGTDRMWDIAQVLRLTRPEPEPLFALGVDDSHQYHDLGPEYSNSGRGWIMVRSRYLTPEHLLHAMQRGDFYASSGVTLKDIRASGGTMTVEIDAEPGVTYHTEFIGTRRGFDRESEPVKDAEGNPLPVTRRYSSQVGEVFADVVGPNPSYDFRGDELYVRARITSNQEMTNPSQPGETRKAWTQPIFLPGNR